MACVCAGRLAVASVIEILCMFAGFHGAKRRPCRDQTFNMFDEFVSRQALNSIFGFLFDSLDPSLFHVLCSCNMSTRLIVSILEQMRIERLFCDQLDS